MKRIILPFMAITLLIVAQTQAQVPINGLVARYPFSGNANDASGNGNNGTVSGATLTADRFGNANSAYNFNGVNNYIYTSTNTNVPLGNNPRTFTLWMKSNDTANPSNRDAFNWGSCTTVQRFGIAMLNGYPLALLGSQDLKGNALIGNNLWHNIAVTYDGQSVKMYVDGIFNSSEAISLNTVGSEIIIGRSLLCQTSPVYYGGVLDDICVYNRALDSSEIQAIYHAPVSTVSYSIINSCGSYVWNGTTYSSSGDYSIFIPNGNSKGGDSTAFLHLTINQPSVHKDTLSACGSYVWDGITFTQSGTYNEEFPGGGSKGCDSTSILILTINPNTKDTIHANTSGNYTWHGTTYTQSGIYTIHLTSSVGCDSSVILVLSITLPVKFIEVSAYEKSNKVLLNWQTGEELNSNYFVIQNSADGVSFTDIGNVKAIGAGSNPYQFVDNKPALGFVYYRLESVDKDGAVTFSKVVEVQNDNVVDKYTVYPNPGRENVVIKGSRISSVNVLDVTGRIVKAFSLGNTTNPTIKVKDLQSGCYYIRITDTNGEFGVCRFFKE